MRATYTAGLFLLLLGVRCAPAQTASVDRTVLAEVKRRFGIRTKVVQRLELTEVFGTKGTWSLVVTKQGAEEKMIENPWVDDQRPSHLCMIQNQKVDCTGQVVFGQQSAKWQIDSHWPFWTFYEGKFVYSNAAHTQPLVWLQFCSAFAFNGNCVIQSFLLDYEREEDRFHSIFSMRTGRNNNQEARFIESGPMQGSVVVVYPTENAPFTYFVEVYQRKEGKEYQQVLRYRGKTRYGDGNWLAVIDSEMAEIQRRFGFWKPGDALPQPARLPSRCQKLEWRNEVIWCGAR